MLTAPVGNVARVEGFAEMTAVDMSYLMCSCRTQQQNDSTTRAG